MARVEQAVCMSCGEVYAYVDNPAHWRRENVCSTCKSKERDGRLMALKIELSHVTKSPILQLLAEMTVLRTTLAKLGHLDEVRHFEQVIECAKQIVGDLDGKADQTESRVAARSEDPTG